MAPKKVQRAVTENISLGPNVREGEHNLKTLPKAPSSRGILTLLPLPGELVFGVARIFASFNDTFVHVTDLSYV